MQNKLVPLTEQELAEKVIYLHDVTGLGFRKVAKALTAQGVPTNKDGANRLYHKYEKDCNANVEEDKELKRLSEAEDRAREQLILAREKAEARKRLTALFAESKTMTFELRRKLFTDPEKLLRFAQRTMPVVDPMLWSELKECCEEQGYDLANALSIALGDQRDFEHVSAQAEGKKGLDSYLAEGVRRCLSAWKADKQEEGEGESELTADNRKDEEYVTIEIPWQ
jgi:hypothetical protein